MRRVKSVDPSASSETGYGAVAARASVKDTSITIYTVTKTPKYFAAGGFKNLNWKTLKTQQVPDVKGQFELEWTGLCQCSGDKICLSPALGFD